MQVFFVEHQRIFRVSAGRYYPVVSCIRIHHLARHMQRARAHVHYIHAPIARRAMAAPCHQLYTPATPRHAPSHPAAIFMPRRASLVCVCGIRVYLRFATPSLCFCECNNTIALNLKINTIPKRYSPNTHKLNQTQNQPKTNTQPPNPIHKIRPITLYTPRRAWYTWHVTYNSNALPIAPQPVKRGSQRINGESVCYGACSLTTKLRCTVLRPARTPNSTHSSMRGTASP